MRTKITFLGLLFLVINFAAGYLTGERLHPFEADYYAHPEKYEGQTITLQYFFIQEVKKDSFSIRGFKKIPFEIRGRVEGIKKGEAITVDIRVSKNNGLVLKKHHRYPFIRYKYLVSLAAMLLVFIVNLRYYTVDFRTLTIRRRAHA